MYCGHKIGGLHFLLQEGCIEEFRRLEAKVSCVELMTTELDGCIFQTNLGNRERSLSSECGHPQSIAQLLCLFEGRVFAKRLPTCLSHILRVGIARRTFGRADREQEILQIVVVGRRPRLWLVLEERRLWCRISCASSFCRESWAVLRTT
ncbi:hypothetical protein CB0940_10881 [Cercospora beticola]|uniref:Uncharacterized protein n=1 Tax=Cercospora beticola TaxID=122368 RepID=A0A2G5HCU1_CERBT|nr:hypothetical protein CB0940_10881 [Cercospora beticola]PIA90360.1 hypothetical protein CB0940_10881 [Cercospora beticola]